MGAGIPDERDRNRVSVSKSICHSEFPESTRACACARGHVHLGSREPAIIEEFLVHAGNLVDDAGKPKCVVGPPPLFAFER